VDYGFQARNQSCNEINYGYNYGQVGMPIKPHDGEHQYQPRKGGVWPRTAVGCHEYWPRKDLQQLKVRMEPSLI
jgi:hypothetical protein